VTEQPDVVRLVSHQRRLLRGLVIALIAVTIGFGTMLAVYYTDHTTQWSPLAVYPTQQVLNRAHLVEPVATAVTISGQVVHIPADTVAVIARKCNRSGDGFVITGRSRWQLLAPSGLGRVANARGQRIVAPHECVVKTPTDPYLNVVPKDVLDRAAALCTLTRHASTWNINGEDTPQREDDVGVSRLWHTEPFQIACAA
jgi:hypothetical protein